MAASLMLYLQVIKRKVESKWVRLGLYIKAFRALLFADKVEIACFCVSVHPQA
jgi:hypothetical protein